MTLFGIYLLLTFIIILNLLIALMSAKITHITAKGIQKYKFQRTSNWLHYLERDHCYLPSPANISEFIFHWSGQCWRNKPAGSSQERREKYLGLIDRLTTRYINRVEDGTTENRDITVEDINNAKREIIGLQHLR